jgi:hypothetical protein
MGRASQWAMATVSKTAERQPCEFDSHPFRLLGDRLAVGCLTLNQETEVRALLPEMK